MTEPTDHTANAGETGSAEGTGSDVAETAPAIDPGASDQADPSPPRAAWRAIEGTTAKERRAFGRAIRREVPRGAHGDWRSATDRPDPVALLVGQSRGRIPDLVPIRYGRMLGSPFAFYRGAALVMAADLARAPASGLYVAACGDAHLSNFGIFATPERRLVFDVNDFDETHPAPFEWDVKRLATSLVLVARQQGLGDGAGRRMATFAARAYRRRIRQLAEMGFLDAWHSRIDISARLEEVRLRGTRRERRTARRFVEKASTRTNLGSLRRLAAKTDGAWHLREDPPLVVRPELTPDALASIREALTAYRRSLRADLRPILEHYAFADIARKVVGVGSVGLRSYMILMVAPADEDPLFLQLKEARASVMEPYTERRWTGDQGERVVIGQRFMQAASDELLGWIRIDGPEQSYDGYVRQLRDWKMSFDVDTADEAALIRYGRFCAHALARAHARSGSSLAIAGYLGRGPAFDRAIARFAVAYADQTEADHAAFQRAVREGRIVAADVE